MIAITIEPSAMPTVTAAARVNRQNASRQLKVAVVVVYSSTLRL
jgi:hypothetical protein